jgi:hypothetical protein
MKVEKINNSTHYGIMHISPVYAKVYPQQFIQHNLKIFSFFVNLHKIHGVYSTEGTNIVVGVTEDERKVFFFLS